MEKILLFKEILRFFFWLLTDTDRDGRPDIFDSDPDNPEVQ